MNWEVEQAVDFSHFEIEQSSDGLTFSTIGRTTFSASQSLYKYTQSPVTTPNNYYRLKLVNQDGSYRYSNIILLKIASALKELTVYPQPAREYININIAARQNQRVMIRVFNSSGVAVKDERVQLNTGNNSFLIDNLQILTPGLYILKTTIDGKSVSKKIVIGSKY